MAEATPDPIEPEAVDSTAPDATAAPAAPDAAAAPDANEDLKAKYREAMAHKQGSSGAHRSGHGDKGEAAHSQSTGPSQRLFRRKSGG